ncbi:serine/threonine-protein kinase Sgk2 [Dactylonectria macrodidyma]|uniref:Serine/threonine-protein kinase Sgk2 n=1 Tax=Dactylonectria macrodidyma TaxID=307937 RepID=A0A9P9FTD5_9HYPO|nr:serine/threonine-protein kinase Sgk2 [Dactylonectria macrodidyma]
MDTTTVYQANKGQAYHHGCVSYQDGLLHLCRSAHQVFASQPTRLFLHGFYIRGSLIGPWISSNFSRLFLSYQRMTDQDLRNVNTIGTDESGSYIFLDSVGMPPLGKPYLESQPVVSCKSLVGTETTCYRARMPGSNRWNYVLKFKWRWARERPEDELLRLAKKKCVWGAVSLDYYKEVESTENLRRDLRWGTHRKFTWKHFRERHGSIEEQRQEVTWNANGLVEYAEETNNFFQNPILACIITSPCHRPLCYDAKILHQDISPGNMIIRDGQEGGKPKGTLIDPDSAIELTKGLGTEFRIAGTRPLMAIGVLKGECHTYRHDLESFLYVFLWTIITNHTEKPPETSKLRQWSKGDWNELAVRKPLDMDQDSFQSILEEFTPEFHPLKSLTESLRQTLFPLWDGVIWTGTDGSPEAVDKLDDGMIPAFDRRPNPTTKFADDAIPRIQGLVCRNGIVVLRLVPGKKLLFNGRRIWHAMKVLLCRRGRHFPPPDSRLRCFIQMAAIIRIDKSG